jgi:hypothetical protein
MGDKDNHFSDFHFLMSHDISVIKRTRNIKAAAMDISCNKEFSRILKITMLIKKTKCKNVTII